MIGRKGGQATAGGRTVSTWRWVALAAGCLMVALLYPFRWSLFIERESVGDLAGMGGQANEDSFGGLEEAKLSVGSPETTGGDPASPATARVQSQPSSLDGTAESLVAEILELVGQAGDLSKRELGGIGRIMDELVRLGEAAVGPVEELLRSGRDKDLAGYGSGVKTEWPTMRIALIDTLGRIGGQQAREVLLAVLEGTGSPGEIAWSAEGLDSSAPGRFRSEIITAARGELVKAEYDDHPAPPQEMGHLFGVLMDFGDASTAADLETFYFSADGAVADYSLMALANLSGGAGIPRLIEIARSIASQTGVSDSRFQVAVEMLAQASRHSPEAGAALVNLAASGEIGGPAMVKVARALEGREYTLVSRSSAMGRQTSAATGINHRAADTWTQDEIQQRIELIDQLLGVTPQGVEANALRVARRGLAARLPQRG